MTGKKKTLKPDVIEPLEPELFEPETMLTVVMSSAWTNWGEKITLRLLNPDGTTCIERSWECGPDGFNAAAETDMSEWVGEQAQDFMETTFASMNEQLNFNRTNRPGN